MGQPPPQSSQESPQVLGAVLLTSPEVVQRPHPALTPLAAPRLPSPTPPDPIRVILAVAPLHHSQVCPGPPAPAQPPHPPASHQADLQAIRPLPWVLRLGLSPPFLPPLQFPAVDALPFLPPRADPQMTGPHHRQPPKGATDPPYPAMDSLLLPPLPRAALEEVPPPSLLAGRGLLCTPPRTTTPPDYPRGTCHSTPTLPPPHRVDPDPCRPLPVGGHQAGTKQDAQAHSPLRPPQEVAAGAT